MKRLVALILTAVLALGMIPFAGAAFTDADKIAAGHKEAVTYVSEKKVISGFPDGSFQPQGTLTRAQAAKILCVALEGADKAEALTKTDTGFSDVPASHWAAKYVAYCAEKGIVAGVGDGKFAPDAALTAAAFGKMLLVAYGKAKAETLVGKDWIVNTQKAMRQDNMKEGLDTIGNEPTTRENACHMAYNFIEFDEIAKADPEKYKETTISFTDGKNYRVLGRAWQDKDGVVCDYSADGVEFTLDCVGDIVLTCNASEKQGTTLKYRVIVDGVPSDQVNFKVGGEESLTVIGKRIQPGLHTIRILKDTQVSHSKDTLKSITLRCAADTMKATQPKKRMIEVIGDSSTAGYGAVVTSTPNTTKNSSSITLSYAYLVPDALDADWEMCVKGSLGVVRQTGEPPYNYAELYEYRNRWRDPDTRFPFERKADLVLLKISGNDNSVDVAEWKAAMTKFIEVIRSYHGADTPVVFWGQTGLKKRPYAQELMKEIPNLYGVFSKGNNDGMGGHPSAEAQKRFTEEILKVVRPIWEALDKK